jgi:hypothetical protein
MLQFGRSRGGSLPPLGTAAMREGWTVMLLVVDGDENADIYGYAETARQARVIADACFVDKIERVECYGPISLRDGRTLAQAFVVITRKP